MARPRMPRTTVHEIRWGVRPYVRRFLEQGEAHAFAAQLGVKTEGRTTLATASQLHRWGLGPPPSRLPRPRRAARSHPPICPACGAHWYGPGRPRRGQDGRRLAPVSKARLAPSPDPWADRPDLAGLFDPRLADDGEP